MFFICLGLYEKEGGFVGSWEMMSLVWGVMEYVVLFYYVVGSKGVEFEREVRLEEVDLLVFTFCLSLLR